MTTAAPAPLVIGVPGPFLDSEQRAALRDVRPVGMIVFARNVQSQDQLRALTDRFREAVDLPEAMVMVDQEGGRVQQLRGPDWPAFPSFGRIGRLATDGDVARAEAAAREMARAIGAGLVPAGIDTVCSPVVDLDLPEGDAIIGHRAFSADPAVVTRLGRAVCDGFLSVGVTPILKHIPGHGRAPVDSHKATPMVDTDLATLDATDFTPFRALDTQPWAMVAHVVYRAVDPERPASISPAVVDRVIRRRLGFDGVLISDCLYMEALRGPVAGRCAAAVAAGLDLALACHGDHRDWRAFAHATGSIAPASWARLQADHARRVAGRTDGTAAPDPAATARDLHALLPAA